jgi:hypothetical protein
MPQPQQDRMEDKPKGHGQHHNNPLQATQPGNNDNNTTPAGEQQTECTNHDKGTTGNNMEDGTTTIQHGPEQPGNTPHYTPSSTHSNKATTYTKHPIQTTCRTKTNYTPHKKCGVIFEAIEGITIEQYLRAIADNVGGINIKYASRLSGRRICVYFDTEDHVRELCAPGGININDTFIPCRPYIMASKRVVLSNVLPDIPNEALMPPQHRRMQAPRKMHLT